MATQPSRPRPLFRLPTIARQTAAQSALVPSPAKPALPSSTVATSVTPKAAPSPSSVPTSLAAQTSSPTKTATSTPKTIEPIVQNLPQSPKPKPTATAPPPSGLTILPNSQLKSKDEIEQKDELGRIKTIGKEEVSKENETKPEMVEMVKSSCKNIMDLEKAVGSRVVTIAGENKGAFMKVIQSSKKHEVAHKNENPKTKSYGGNESESSTTSIMPMRAFVNSNVQSINNSFLYNCSCTDHDPGVHLSLSRN